MVYIFLILCLFYNSFGYVYAEFPSTCYARIMIENVFLYKNPIEVDDYTNIQFVLPRTYFVELIDEENNFFKVNYLNFTGYVKKDSVKPIIGTPQNPYLTNIKFRVYAETSRDLRTEPITSGGSSSQVNYIPLYSRNLTYYGSIIGEQVIEGRTNIWYYCKYTADKDYYGYVYSDFCDELTQITENTEEFEYTSAPNFSAQSQPITESLPAENKTTGIIILIITIPALIVLFMILKSSKILNKSNISNKEVIDY